MICWFLLLLSCGEKESTKYSSLLLWPTEPESSVQRCKIEKRLKPLCWINAAVVHFQKNRVQDAEQICMKLEGIWYEECYFQLGERSAIQGNLLLGIQYCNQSRKFKLNCLSHVLELAPKGRELRRFRRALFKNIGNWTEFDRTLYSIPKLEQQEILLLILTIEHPNNRKELCNRIKTQTIKKNCL